MNFTNFFLFFQSRNMNIICKEYSQIYSNIQIFATICYGVDNISKHYMELTDNIPIWAYYQQLGNSNPQLGIIYPFGDWA